VKVVCRLLVNHFVVKTKTLERVGIMSVSQKCNYIRKYCADNDIFYLKANVQFPEESIQEALQVLEEGFFVKHRGGQSAGWQSCALWGWGKGSPEYYRTMNPSGYGFTEEEVVWGWTEIEEIAPRTKQFLSDTYNMEYMRRCRFMLLEPGGWIEAHDDGKERSIHSAVNVAITQPENCYLRRVDTKEEVPFKPREMFFYDNRVVHEAKNDSNENRLHFIIHGFRDQMAKQLLIDSFEEQYHEIEL
jgi:hypothetical protein